MKSNSEAIKCVGLIPAETAVRPGQPLNVLVMAISAAEVPVEQEVRIYGRLAETWRPLTCKLCTLAPGEHAHLYFQIPAACFTPEFWGTAEPVEELVLAAGTELPADSQQGELVFCQ